MECRDNNKSYNQMEMKKQKENENANKKSKRKKVFVILFIYYKNSASRATWEVNWALFLFLHFQDTSPHPYRTVHPRNSPSSDLPKSKLIHNLFSIGSLTCSVTFFPYHHQAPILRPPRLSSTPIIPSCTLKESSPVL